MVTQLRMVFIAALVAASVQAAAAADPGAARVKSVPATITLESVPMILNPADVPPAPAGAGATTLAGVDVNGNGIRDDAERWIAEKYPDCAGFRAALAQLALAVQRKIVTPEVTEETAKDLATEEGAGTACLDEEAASCGTASFEKMIEFSMLLQNTPERSAAYMRVYRLLGAKSLSMRSGGCKIPSQKLPK